MLATVEKAGERTRATRLIDAQVEPLQAAFMAFVARARKIDVATLLAGKGGIEAVMRAVDAEIVRFSNSWPAAFVSVATAEAPKVRRNLGKATATVTVDFNPGDPEAARRMEQNRLNLVTNLTAQQRGLTRQALVEGMQRGEGVAEMARRFRDSIGLSAPQQQANANYRATLERGRMEAAFTLPGETPVLDMLTARQIDRMVAADVQARIAQRAEAIARTEALRIVTQARDEALRQSLRAVGQSAQLSGKEWAAAHDGRTRPAHAERDGQRRRLDEAFAGGIQQPGDGPAGEAINCRCTLLYSVFETEDELQAWLAGT